MSNFKRESMDNENVEADNNASEPSQKRQRVDERGRGRGGRDRRGGRGGGDRGRGGGDRGRGRGSRGRFNSRGRGRGRGGDRGRGEGRGRGRGGRGRGNFNGTPARESKLKVGQDAPDFSNILNDKSESISLSQFQGKYVVLFIYFKNGNFAAKSLHAGFGGLTEKFSQLNATIFGVSRDDSASHSTAVKDNNLNFSLLSDTNAEITNSYDSIQGDRVDNSTFLISPEGKIAAIWFPIRNFEQHPQKVLEKLTKIVNGEDDNEDEAKKDNEDQNKAETNENEDNDDDDDDDDDNDNEENADGNRNNNEEDNDDDDDDDDDDANDDE